MVKAVLNLFCMLCVQVGVGEAQGTCKKKFTGSALKGILKRKDIIFVLNKKGSAV